MTFARPLSLFVSLGLIAAAASGCSVWQKGEAKYPTGYDRTTTGGDIYGERESFFGSDGLNIFGGKGKEADDGSTGIGVNSFLWRASLDTISFMPLASADPFGGVIITDWYSAPNAPEERFKVNVFILDKQLRSDGVQVKVFRQVRSGNGWTDAQVSQDTAPKLEDAILARARELRIAELNKE